MSTRPPGEEWFREWFGEDYLRVYPHRDASEAAGAVDLFLTESRSSPGDRVLDLACGAGRHLALLREAGLVATGLDLSRLLLVRAREPGARGGAVRGDMRTLPFRTAAFRAVVQFFTSYGYFATREEDRRVLHEVRRVLPPGGTFLLDFLNARRVREELVAEDELRRGDRTIRQRRWIEDGVVVKRIEIEGEREDPAVYHERVRLYEPEELTGMLAGAGLSARSRFGDYDGSSFRIAESPRLVIVGEAT